MILKAAIIGTHGTIKTTLAHHLGGALKEEKADVYTIQEIARKCPYPLNGIDIRAQKWIAANQYLREIEEKRHFEIIESENKKTQNIPRILLCDRSTLDAYIYTVDLCKKQNLNMPSWIPELVSENMPSYDFLFLTSMSSSGIDDDGVRSIDPEYQKTIDNLLRKYLNKKKIKYHALDYSPLNGNASPTKTDYKKLREAQVEQMVEIITKKWKK